MEKSFRHTPLGYDGTKLTSHKISDILPNVLSRIDSKLQDRPNLILAAWPEVIGCELAPMTQATAFNDGLLFVKVKNSTLHRILRYDEKPNVLNLLRKKFPHIEIKDIIFSIR